MITIAPITVYGGYIEPRFVEPLRNTCHYEFMVSDSHITAVLKVLQAVLGTDYWIVVDHRVPEAIVPVLMFVNAVHLHSIDLEWQKDAARYIIRLKGLTRL